MHGIYKDKTILDAALSEAFFNLGGDIDKSTPGWDLKPEFFSVTLHGLHDSKPADKAQEPKLRYASLTNNWFEAVEKV